MKSIASIQEAGPVFEGLVMFVSGVRQGLGDGVRVGDARSIQEGRNPAHEVPPWMFPEMESSRWVGSPMAMVLDTPGMPSLFRSTRVSPPGAAISSSLPG